MTKNENLRLTVDQVQGLNALAAAVGAFATRGSTAGEPSWRVLVQWIGDGQLGVAGASGSLYVVPSNADSFPESVPVFILDTPVRLGPAGFLPPGDPDL